MNEPILISGLPATPERWDAWMESIGAGPKATKATLAAHRETVKLAEQLKQQQERRDNERHS